MKNNYKLKTQITTLLLCFVLAITGVKAQCIIGTGTTTTNGTVADPVERYYNYEHFQTVYTAAELTAGGMTGGSSITAIGYSISESAVSLANFTIDMGHTLQATANPYIAAGLTNVRPAFTYAPIVQAAGSFDMIALTTPFVWNGTSNIVVNTCTGSNPFTSPYGGLRYTAVATGGTRYNRVDGSSNCATATNTNTTNRPNIRFDFTPGAACSGTPTAGVTSGPASICTSVNFTLSLSGASTGTGLTYQWQSSTDNVTYTNIGSTSSTATVSQTAATYYQCIVTCTSSGMSATSTPLLVNMNAVFTCYCSSMPTFTADEEITNVTFGTLNNTSNCTTPAPGPGSIVTRYANYLSGAGAPAAPSVARTNPTSISVTVGSCGVTNYTSGLAIFIDLNQNGSFADAGEKVYSNGAAAAINCVPATVVNGTITIPMTANLGLTAMRIINAESSSGNAITSCFSYGYGETEDYLINIVDLPATPPTPTQSAGIPTCASGTDLSVAGAPAAGDAWYWQTTALGTSTATPVLGAYTVFLNGTYYVRTYNTTNALWSATSDSVTVTNIPVAPLPPAPTAVSPSCLNTSITVAAASGTTTYYWQGTNSTGTSTALDAASPYTASASGTYYVAAYDAATSCWSNTNSIAVVIDTYVPAAPTSTSNPLNVCIGTATAMINASAPASGTLTASFGTSLVSTGAPVNINITVPALPAGAVITGTQLQVIGATAVGGSYRSEIRVALAGSTTLVATQISALASSGLITPDPAITVPNLPLAGGLVTLTLTETFDDGGTGVVDATFTEIRLVVSYTLPSSTITWWDATTGGTQIGTGSPFESVGTAILPNTSTLGTYAFYAMATAGTCSSSRLTVDVIVNPLPTVTASSSASTVCAGTMVTLNGGGALSYTWDNGVTNNVAFASTTATTIYNVIGTDIYGCTNTAAVSLTVNALPVASSIITTPVACNGGMSTVTVSATGGTPSYTGTGAMSAPAGPYSFVVTDAAGCASAPTTGTITEPTTIAVTSTSSAILCNGGTSTVTIAATGGTGALTGTGTFTQSAGTTVYTVTDANSCTGTASVVVTQPTVVMVMVSSTPILCNGGTSTVTVTAMDGTPGYTGEGTFTQSAGTTVYTVTDANSCTGTASVVVTEPTALVASNSTTSILCNGGTGTVTVTATGGTPTYTGTGALPQSSGTTVYTVTDANGCVTTTSATLTEPTAIVISPSETGVLCAGGNSTVTIAASGGTPGYSGVGSFTQSAGTITYTVTDANACTASLAVTVVEPTAMAATSSSTAIACNGGSSTVTVVATGGTTPYTNDGTFSQLAGTTVYTVTDANGCIATTSETISEPSAIVVTPSTTAILCNGGTSTVTITAAGGTGALTGEGTFTQAAGTMAYTVTDANSCAGTASVVITEPAAIATAQTVNFCGSGSVTVGPSTYTTAGTYTDILTAANTCDSTVTTTVTVTTVDVATSVVGAVITANSATGTYLWLDCNAAYAALTPAETNQAYTSTANGSYAVQITDNGCVDTSACVVISTTGIDNNSANVLSVYPNPTMGMFNIAIANANIAELVITIVDIQGKEVFSSVDKNVNGTFNKQINLEEIAKGLYYIKMNTGAEVKIQKLIVQ